MTPTNVEIRQFIVECFNEPDFVDLFCSDYFPQARADFSADMSFSRKAQRLIDYCQNREVVENLLAGLQKERPEAYARRFGQVAPGPGPQQVPTAPQATVRNLHRIFISHASADAEIAHRLAGDLKLRGWLVWIAPDSIRLGEKWVAAIERGLDESGVFLALLTPAANTSNWVKNETETAIALENDGAIRLFPLMVQWCTVRTVLRAYQYVSIVDSYQDGLAQLIARLEELSTPEAISTPTRPPNPLVLETPFHLELVRVPAGEFLMGSDPAKDKDAEKWKDEQPQHRVYVSEYYIGKYDVTNAQFALFVQATRYQTSAEKKGSGYVWNGSKWDDVKGADWQHPRGPGSDIAQKQNHPVVQVGWDDAKAFCDWLAQSSGKPIRLPREAEWEKAARGPSAREASGDGRIYPWGNEWDPSRLNSSEGGVGDTTPVGKYSPAGDSPYGAADMAGNVWRWCTDWYNENEYQKRAKSGSPIKDPIGPARGEYRVLRGGSFDIYRSSARSAGRYGNSPVGYSAYFGFRVVVSPISPPSAP